MKKSITTIVLVLFALCQLLAQVPQSINYQTIVRGQNGQPLADQTVSLKFSVLLDGVSGSVLYAEKHVKPTNQFGIINLQIGKGTAISGQFSDIDWGAGRMFLNTQLDVNGGDNFTEMGTTEMISVPYALHAGSIYVHYANDTLYIGDQRVYLPRGNGNGGPVGDQVIDYDGNIYATVTIGTQTWLAENLKSAHYADGTTIEGVYDYENNASIGASYGKLYTWEAAMRGAAATGSSQSGVQGVCPAGWHLPSISEIETLRDYIGSYYGVGGGLIGRKMKEPGTTYWETDNGNNETGFGGRGAGMMYLDGQEIAYQQMKVQTYFWSTTERTGIITEAMRMVLYDSGVVATSGGTPKTSGLSVRCIKN
jgi:uncharacterized protein (TIGR02145 family)